MLKSNTTQNVKAWYYRPHWKDINISDDELIVLSVEQKKRLNEKKWM